ncbi:MAG: acyltransferase family protein [Agathobacter sp.]|nr:acyltransferase family protein [Agathobacter sp.]
MVKDYLNYLRGLATLAVIVIHVSAQYWGGYYGATSWLVFTAYEGVCRVAVPLFFMISGCLFLDKGRDKSIRSLYTVNIMRLVVFLIFWAMIYKMLFFPMEATLLDKILTSLSEIAIGDTQTHLWYIYAIIGMYILSPILKVFANNATQKQLLYAIGCCFVLSSVHVFVIEFPELSFIANHLSKIKGGIEVGYIGFFLLGYYIDNYEIGKKTRIRLYLTGGVGIILTIAMVMWDCITHYAPLERFWGYTMPGMVLAAVAVFVFFKYRKLKIKIIDNFLEKVSKYSLGIYGCHMIVITCLWIMGYTTFSFHALISVPLISLVVLLISFATAFLIQKIPLVGKYLA